MSFKLNSRHKAVVDAVFTQPTLAGIVWDDIEALLRALARQAGGKVEEREGSRVLFRINGRKALLHRPHPEKETDKGAVESVRDFLTLLGVR